MDNSPANDELLDTAAAGAFLKLAPMTLKLWRSQGRGPAYVRQGNRVAYLRSDLLAWARAHRVVPSAAPSPKTPPAAPAKPGEDSEC